ncbi:ABC transporter permease [Thalassobacillus hwangdonensis]|uniref:ABC transporter permease n=1 Tax=Thalassobacillus hwangdonensis TaxID=546108 RepID=A0ABW3KZL4_9BACI
MPSKFQRPIFWLIIICFFIFPIFALVFQSFTPVWRFGEPVPLDFRLDSWDILFQDERWISATFWSVFISLWIILINLAIGMLTGKAMAFSNFKGKALLEALFLAPVLLPVLAIAMGLHLMMIRLGLADTWIGVMLIHLVPTIPYSIKIFTNAYQQMGEKLIEQASMLGATSFRSWLTIELPMLKPPIRSVIFLTMVISLSQYAITSIIGGGQVITLAMVFFPYLDTANGSLLAAFSLWFALLPFLLYACLEALMKLLPYQTIRWRK